MSIPMMTRYLKSSDSGGATSYVAVNALLQIMCGSQTFVIVMDRNDPFFLMSWYDMILLCNDGVHSHVSLQMDMTHDTMAYPVKQL